MAEDGPLGPGSRGLAFQSADGVALRGAHLPGGEKGCVLLLQGRTETMEKYIPVAARLRRMGWSSLALDWRGQGGSQRLTADPLLGHVDDFAAYQRDLDALMARDEASPRPRALIAHSMGGCIALRRLVEKPDFVERAIFSAPMWGLFSNRLQQGFGALSARIACAVGLATRRVPSSGATPYPFEPFADNVLTSDPEQFAEMARLARARPELALAGPSWGWIRAAMREMRALTSQRLKTSAMVGLGSDENLVRPGAIRARAARDGLRLVEVHGARHEPFFEAEPQRDAFWRAIEAELTLLH